MLCTTKAENCDAVLIFSLYPWAVGFEPNSTLLLAYGSSGLHDCSGILRYRLWYHRRCPGGTCQRRVCERPAYMFVQRLNALTGKVEWIQLQEGAQHYCLTRATVTSAISVVIGSDACHDCHMTLLVHLLLEWVQRNL